MRLLSPLHKNSYVNGSLFRLAFDIQDIWEPINLIVFATVEENCGKKLILREPEGRIDDVAPDTIGELYLGAVGVRHDGRIKGNLVQREKYIGWGTREGGWESRPLILW